MWTQAAAVILAFVGSVDCHVLADDQVYPHPPPLTTSYTASPLTLLPQDAGDESPACLDGSKYGYYYTPSTTGSTKWTIFIEGGGWCYDEDLCYTRSKNRRGTSKVWPKTAPCGCMNVKDGVIDHDCNCLYMPYGDGASFSGFRKDKWPVKAPVHNTNTTGGTTGAVNGGKQEYLYFRGIKNFDATMDAAFKLGLGNATDFVLTGGSAGGLSTFLHLDRIADRLKKEAPTCKVRGAPVVGYFLDHDNYKHDAHNYTAFMKYIYHMQNLTDGSDGALSPECIKAFPNSPHHCFMAPHMQRFIKTPFFMFNSKYDAWQLGNELQTPWATKAEQKAVLQYGDDFMYQFNVVTKEEENGAFITSCICHGCPWPQLQLNGLTSIQHYIAWHQGKTKGPASIHIDDRLPNGNGALKYSTCMEFPHVDELQVQ